MANELRAGNKEGVILGFNGFYVLNLRSYNLFF